MSVIGEVIVCAAPSCKEVFKKKTTNHLYHTKQCKREVERLKERQDLLLDISHAIAKQQTMPQKEESVLPSPEITIDFLRKEVQRLGREVEKHKSLQYERNFAVQTALTEGLKQFKLSPVKPPIFDKSMYESELVAVVGFSDVQLSKTTPTYDTDVAEARMYEYIEKCIEIVQIHRQGRPVNVCHVWALGDIIEGCFSGDTQVITREGLRPISELANEGHAEIKSTYGKWIEAKFESFGTQRLWKLELSRANNTIHKTVYTTQGHRWFTLEKPAANSKKVEILTHDLVAGDMLVSNFGRHPQNMSPIGIMAGFVYGDGNRNNAEIRENGCSVNVYRQKWGVLKYFNGHPMSDVQKDYPKEGWNSTIDSDFIKVSALPSFFKDLPDVGNESLSYLYGWAAGYFAADGTVKKTGTISITSRSKIGIECFRDVCARIGIGTNPIMVESDKDSVQYVMSLVAGTVPIDFIVHPTKRRILEDHRADSKLTTLQKNTHQNWKVVSCEPTDKFDEVYCAIVPDTHTFTIDGDILTGNSGIFPGQNYVIDAGFYRQVTIHGPRIFANCLRRLLEVFEYVEVHCVIGNHGRLGSRHRDEFDPETNGDRMLYRILDHIFANEPRINFVIPDGPGERNWYDVDEIGNYRTLLCHGDQFQGINSLYTVGRKVMSWKEAIPEDWDDIACFTADTLILTDKGHKPISQIEIGDMVLTHKNRFMPVINTMSRKADTITIKGQGHPGITCTYDHPFYSASMNYKSDNTWDYIDSLDWHDAEKLLDMFWVSPASFPVANIPPISYTNMNQSKVNMTPNLFKLLGRWLADGYYGYDLRSKKVLINSISITGHIDELEEIKELFEVSGLAYSVTRIDEINHSCVVTSYCSALGRWMFDNFGKQADKKRIPTWVLGLPEDYRLTFMEGYISGDGHYPLSEEGRKYESNSVSKDIAIGIKLLGQTLGHHMSLYVDRREGTMVFPGRFKESQIKDRWITKGLTNIKRWVSSFYKDDFFYSKVKEIQESGLDNVYNITVAEDESYIADGLVVHNCGHFHQSMRFTFGKTIMRVFPSSESDNTYALEKLASTGTPMQHLMFVDPARGIVDAEYDIVLT